MATLRYIDLGRLAYEPALALQKRLVAQVAAAPDVSYLLLVEHEPAVITMGRRARAEHILASSERLSAAGIEVHQTSRGGDVTYHGPGQLVGYPILKLDPRRRSLHQYIRGLEGALISLAARWGVEAERIEGATGVWVGRRKIAAIGVAVQRWVTWHGFALNVSVDLSRFGLIVPCGLADMGVTDLSQLRGQKTEIAEVKGPLVECFAAAMGFDRVEKVACPV